MGYGGVIHHFKNFVLRKEISRHEKITAQLGAATVLLDTYDDLPLSESEHVAINDIRSVLKKYELAAAEVKRAIKNKLSSVEIDRRVKIDDTLALRGLDILRKANILHSEKLGSGLNKSLQIGKLRTILGYGGMIHAFKNYVLRSEHKHEQSAKSALLAAQETIQLYQSSNTISSNEKLALDDIEKTIKAYLDGLNKIHSLIDQGKTTEEVDFEVRVDDQYALRGLSMIDREINHQIEIQEHNVTLAFNDIQNVSQSMLIVSLTFILLAILICAWMISQKISKPIKDMSNVMIRLAQDDTDVDVSQYIGKNEIGSMAKSINTFKENITKRINAEEATEKAHNELNAQLDELKSMRQTSDVQAAKALSLAEGLATARDEALAASKLNQKKNV